MAQAQVFRNIGALLTLDGAFQKKGRDIQEPDLSLIEKAAMVVQDGKILWTGAQKNIPRAYAKKSKEIDLQGATVLPGFVECHTHTLFAGTRSNEFEQRLQGVSYQEIAKKGGGILSTMRETRKASSGTLKSLAEKRVQKFVEQGVTTLEIKTGYALDEKNEIKSLKVINSLENAKSPHIVSTFLGAHSLPPEFSHVSEYLQYLTSILPKIKKLTRRVDIWIEKGFFEVPEGRKYLQAAKDLGFQTVIHADQLTLSGGAELATELASLSADHVIQLQESQIQKIARSETTAVLLPLADLYMKCAYPPARKLIEAGARVALATDFNPGTCPSQDLATTGLLARLEMKMSLPEVISAYTVGGAFALGQFEKCGSLSSGKAANFVCIDADWTSLFYSAGAMNISKTYRDGRPIYSQSK